MAVFIESFNQCYGSCNLLNCLFVVDFNIFVVHLLILVTNLVSATEVLANIHTDANNN